MVRKPAVAKSVLKTAFPLMAATVLLAASCEVDLWDVGHSTGDRLHADRPECPVMWDTIPLVVDPKVRATLLELQKKGERESLPRGIRITGSSVVFTPLGVVNPVDGSTTANGELPLSGPITNIPEFHDCQRFLSSDGAQFDSLFAIFASFKLDATMQSLQFKTVAAWGGGSAAVATVEQISGVVTAHGNGLANFTAVDPNGNDAGTYEVMVTGLPVPPGGSYPSMPVGPGVPTPTMAPGQQRKLVLQTGLPTVGTVAAATIYSYGQGYADLGIGPNFSCLYLYFTSEGALKAKMVPVQRLEEYEHACLTAVDPVQAAGRVLTVRRSMANITIPNQAADYPSVARWDVDPQTGKQYIGIKCLDAWCEIGDGDFKSSESYLMGSATPATDRKVLEIKGWYDEQILAAPGGVGPGNLRPSGLRGTVIPVPGLERITVGMMTPVPGDEDPWTLVGYVGIRDLANDQDAVNYYRETLGLEPVTVGALSTLNQLYFCFGTKDDCQISSGGCDSFWVDWFVQTKRVWVKVISATGVAKPPMCVTRRGHPASSKVPGTSRWRWILGDDTIWMACVNGCCEVET